MPPNASALAAWDCPKKKKKNNRKDALLRGVIAGRVAWVERERRQMRPCRCEHFRGPPWSAVAGDRCRDTASLLLIWGTRVRSIAQRKFARYSGRRRVAQLLGPRPPRPGRQSDSWVPDRRQSRGARRDGTGERLQTEYEAFPNFIVHLLRIPHSKSGRLGWSCRDPIPRGLTSTTYIKNWDCFTGGRNASGANAWRSCVDTARHLRIRATGLRQSDFLAVTRREQ